MIILTIINCERREQVVKSPASPFPGYSVDT
jgi:hypothetical protein